MKRYRVVFAKFADCPVTRAHGVLAWSGFSEPRQALRKQWRLTYTEPWFPPLRQFSWSIEEGMVVKGTARGEQQGDLCSALVS